MKTSIAMATYNGDAFLLEQLISFSKQTLLPDELIIVDDCSTDNTLNVINSFKEIAPFSIKLYINKINLGYTQNFNRALQLCTKDLIFLSDQDDVWSPKKIEYMVSLVNSNQNQEVFMIDAELVDRELQTSGLTKQEQIKNLGLSEKSFVMGCCIAVRKTFLDKILPIPKDFIGHDNWIVALADFLKLRVVDKTVLQVYRQHGDNESNAIYNSLVKINQYSVHRLVKKLIVLFKYSKVSNLVKSLHQKELLLIRLDKLYNHTKYKDTIIKNNKIREEIELLTKRLEIIQTKRIMSRVMKGWSLYRNSDYLFKTFMSDLIFD